MEFPPRQRTLQPLRRREQGKIFHRSKKLFKLSRCKAGIFYNSSHRNRVHRIVAWDGDETRAVAHYNVLALTHNLEASLFKRFDCPEMINTGNLRHR